MNLSNEDLKSIQLNKYLIEFETGSQDNCEIVLGKLCTFSNYVVDILTETNIDLYKKNRPN